MSSQLVVNSDEMIENNSDLEKQTKLSNFYCRPVTFYNIPESRPVKYTFFNWMHLPLFAPFIARFTFFSSLLLYFVNFLCFCFYLSFLLYLKFHFTFCSLYSLCLSFATFCIAFVFAFLSFLSVRTVLFYLAQFVYLLILHLLRSNVQL